MQPWRRLDDGSYVEIVGFRAITRKRFTMNNGSVLDADVIGRDNATAVGVIALTPDNQVIIARQFRCGPEKIFDEMPGGIVDPGETPEQAGKRELEEEVGYASNDFTFLGVAHEDAWSNVAHHYFLARDCYKVAEPHLDEFEEIEPCIISITEFLDNAKHDRTSDASGILLAYDMLKELEKSI